MSPSCISVCSWLNIKRKMQNYTDKLSFSFYKSEKSMESDSVTDLTNLGRAYLHQISKSYCLTCQTLRWGYYTLVLFLEPSSLQDSSSILVKQVIIWTETGYVVQKSLNNWQWFTLNASLMHKDEQNACSHTQVYRFHNIQSPVGHARHPLHAKAWAIVKDNKVRLYKERHTGTILSTV